MKIKTQFQTYLPEETEDKVVEYLLGLKRELAKKIQQRFLNEMLIGVFLYDWNGFKSSHENEIIKLAYNTNIISKNWSIQLQNDTHFELVSYKSEINKRLDSIIHANSKPKIISSQKISSAIFQHVFSENFDKEEFKFLKEAFVEFNNTKVTPWLDTSNSLTKYNNTTSNRLELYKSKIIEEYGINASIAIRDEILDIILSPVHQSAWPTHSTYRTDKHIKQYLEWVKYGRHLETEFMLDLNIKDATVKEIDFLVKHANSKNYGLKFNRGLTEISSEEAKTLCKHEGHLYIADEISEISVEVAKSLSAHKGELSFRGLTQLSIEAAEALSRYKGYNLHLTLAGNEVSADISTALSKYKGCLHLALRTNNLKVGKLNTAAAAALSKHDGKLLSISLSDNTDIEAITELTAYGGEIRQFNETRKDKHDLTRFYSGAFIRVEGTLHLRFSKIDHQIAQALSEHMGSLKLCGDISVKAAEALSRHKGFSLWLQNSISVEAAHALSKYNGPLRLDLSGKEISVDVAEAISQHEGNLSLTSSKEISVDAAQALSKYKGVSLLLNGLKEISGDAAQALSKYKGTRLIIGGLKEISVDAAQALSKYKGRILGLSGLKEISDDAAQALSKYVRAENGPQGIRKILFLDGLKEISVNAAQVFSNGKGWLIDLSGLTEISYEAALILSKSSNRFRFHRLNKYDPKTLIILMNSAGFNFAKPLGAKIAEFQEFLSVECGVIVPKPNRTVSPDGYEDELDQFDYIIPFSGDERYHKSKRRSLA